jgi:hypothetical protein
MDRPLDLPRLEPVGENLWIAEGPDVSFHGFPYPTRMAVARLCDGSLWLWSPIALDDRLRREIGTLGEPRYVVEPNKLHHLALSQWLAAWPSLRAYAPPGLAKKRADIHFAGELDDQAASPWREEIDQLCVAGIIAMTEVLFFHRASRTCLVGDLIQRFDAGSIKKAWQRWLMRTAGLVGEQGSTPIEWRMSFIHRNRARVALARALAWMPEILVIAHGVWAPRNGARELARGLRWLA